MYPEQMKAFWRSRIPILEVRAAQYRVEGRWMMAQLCELSIKKYRAVAAEEETNAAS